MKPGIPLQVFVLGTLIFLGGVLVAAGTLVSSRRKSLAETKELKGRTADLTREAAA